MTNNTSDNDIFHHHLNVLVGGFREHIRRHSGHQSNTTPVQDIPDEIINRMLDEGDSEEIIRRMVDEIEVTQRVQNNPSSQNTPQPPASDQPMSLEETLRYVDYVHSRILNDYDAGVIHPMGQGFMVVEIGGFSIEDPTRPAVPPATDTEKLLDDNVYFATPSDKDKEKCGICLAEYGGTASNPQVRFKKCDHRFHRECAKEWLNNSATCPCCRAKLDQ